MTDAERRRHLASAEWNALAETRHRAKFGTMRVAATDQFKGRQYVCACGTRAWSCWGNAEKHARACDQSGHPVHDKEKV